MHLHHDLDIDVDEICIIFVTKHKRRMFQEGAWGRSNLPQKSPTALSEPKFGPPPPRSNIPGSASACQASKNYPAAAPEINSLDQVGSR